MDNKELIEKFYTSFAKGDAEGMVSCYHDDITFEDPAFGPLKGEDAKNMWRMLVKNSNGQITIHHNNVEANAKTGRANWVAEYTFSKTGRKVINRISAQFEFKDGKIIHHKDTFDFHTWAGQALGLPGKLLGWTSFLRNKVRKSAKDSLAKFTQSLA